MIQGTSTCKCRLAFHNRNVQLWVCLYLHNKKPITFNKFHKYLIKDKHTLLHVMDGMCIVSIFYQ